jgi:hypothetical protein
MGSDQTVGAVFEQQVAVSAILARLFGQAHELSIDDLLFLDRIGNSNDRFDLGDVRAYLTYTGVLAPGPLALATLLTACSHETTAVYTPGDYVVSLTTPSADDGAVLIRLSGLPAGAVDVRPDDRDLVVYTSRVADTLRIAVFGTITPGPLVHIGPLDESVIALIDLRVEETASRSNEQREPLAGYAVELYRRR